MRYRNVSSGIIPAAGFQILPGREVDLTEQQLKNPQILPYLNPSYLVAIVETAQPLPEITSVRQELPKNLVLDGMPESKGVTVVPQTSTEEELKAAQVEEDAKLTVAVPTATIDNGAAIQSVIEVSADKVKKLVEDLKALTSWKKRGEFIAAITDLTLLQATLPEVTGKAKDSVEAQIVELQKIAESQKKK